VGSAGLIGELLDRHDGPACAVIHPSTGLPRPYQAPPASVSRWSVLRALDPPGSLDSAARSIQAANTVLLDGPTDPLVRTLWLPQSILEGYARLPLSAEGILVVDDWHALVTDYIAGSEGASPARPDVEEFDELLVESFHALAEVHLLVVTPRRAPALEDAADVVLNLNVRDIGRGEFEVRVVREGAEPKPEPSYPLWLNRDGLPR
jgi:hypothetical protein